MIICRTPFRVSFFGGGTDYPAWYRENGGAVLATSIDKYCYLTCRYLPPFFEHRFRVVYSAIENCETVDQIAHPAVREVLRHLGIVRGVEIHHDGDLPARSGMGSSSSFTVGLLHALAALEGRMMSKRDLAAQGIEIEQNVLQEIVGSQDQVTAAYGGFNRVDFGRDGAITVHPVTLPRERVVELNDHLMLFYSGLKRTASDVAKSYVTDLKQRETQLRTIAQMVDHALEILGSGDDIARFGHLLHDAWKAKRSVGARVSNPEVDALLDAARGAGALGGKLMGAGSGGFVLLFVPPPLQGDVREALRNLIRVPFKFESAGSQIIFFDREVDYAIEDAARSEQRIEAFREV